MTVNSLHPTTGVMSPQTQTPVSGSGVSVAVTEVQPINGQPISDGMRITPPSGGATVPGGQCQSVTVQSGDWISKIAERILREMLGGQIPTSEQIRKATELIVQANAAQLQALLAQHPDYQGRPLGDLIVPGMTLTVPDLSAALQTGETMRVRDGRLVPAEPPVEESPQNPPPPLTDDNWAQVPPTENPPPPVTDDNWAQVPPVENKRAKKQGGSDFDGGIGGSF